jgi:hypothetical protein
VAEGVRRLEVDEVGDRGQRGVVLVGGQPHRQRRFGIDHRVPGLCRVDPVQHSMGVGAQDGGERRVELRAAALLCEGCRGIDAAQPERHLDELRELREPGGDRYGVSLEVARPATAVPLLVGGADRLLHLARETELLGQGASQRGMALDHPVEVAMARQRELEAHPEPVQRRVARPDEAQRCGGGAQAAHLVVVLPGLQRDVVAEPLGLLVGIRVTSDVDQQGAVVDDRPGLLVEVEPVCQPERDRALPEHVFHGLSEAEVDAQRQCGDELGEAHPGRCGRCCVRLVTDAASGLCHDVTPGHRDEPGRVDRTAAVHAPRRSPKSTSSPERRGW